MNDNRYVFKALVYPSDDKYEAQIPLLDAKTFGNDIAEAVYMAQDLMETIVSYYVEEGIEVPQEELTNDIRYEVPDGGCLVVLFTDGMVPEVEDMTVQDAADILGTTPGNVYAMCNRGKLRHHKVGNTVLVYADSVRERQNSDVRPGRPRKELATV